MIFVIDRPTASFPDIVITDLGTHGGITAVIVSNADCGTVIERVPYRDLFRPSLLPLMECYLEEKKNRKAWFAIAFPKFIKTLPDYIFVFRLELVHSFYHRRLIVSVSGFLASVGKKRKKGK